MLLNPIYGHKGIEMEVKKLRNLNLTKEKEKESELVYKTIQNDIIKNRQKYDEFFDNLDSRVIKVYKRPVFAVMSNNNAVIEVGTSYLLLTIVGCISVNIIPFKGYTVGSETDKSWFLYTKTTYCELDSLLYKINEWFISKFQAQIKRHMVDSGVGEIPTSVTYVRNMVAFDLGDVFITDVKKPQRNSMQVCNINNLKGLIYNYIDGKTSQKPVDAVVIHKLGEYLDSLLVNNKEYVLKLPSREPIPVIVDEAQGEQAKEDSNKKEVIVQSKPTGYIGCRVKALTGKTVEELAKVVDDFFIMYADRIVDIKFSADLLSCVIIYTA